MAAKSVGLVAVGPNYNVPLAGTIGNAVHKMGQKNGRWEMIRQGDGFGSSAVSDVTYTFDGKLFAASQYKGNGLFWEYSSKNPAVPGFFHNRPGNVWRIDGTWVQPDGIWAVDARNLIWKRTGPGGWSNVSGRAIDVGVSGRHTWVIGTDHKPWRYETGSGRPLGLMPGEDLNRISVTNDGYPWAVAKDGSVWAWCEGANTSALLGNLCPKN
jgi:hypothetical protein